eukprot:scaffold105646_cov63-Phaeocystis_antarctica.AAC.1
MHARLVDVALGGELDHDLELLHLDVDRVVVLAEEDLDLVREDRRSLLDDEVDVAQRYVLDLGLRREQRHQRRRHLLVERLERVLARDQVHVLDHDLDGGEHHRRVGVLQPRRHPLDDALGLGGRGGVVEGEGVEDEDLAPLGALVERGEHLLQRRGVDLEDALRRLARLRDLGERGDGVGDHHRVGVAEQVVDHVEEALVLDQLAVDVVQLRHAHRRRLAHIRVLVLQALAQRLAQVLDDLVDADAAHRAHRERADERVGVLRVLRRKKRRGATGH